MVITNVNQVVYQGDGVTTAFPFTFRIIDDTDIKLLLLDSDGTETDITSDYYVDTVNNTVHYPGYASGAEPALSDRPPVLAEGQKLVIYRELPITQEKDLGDKWPFYVIELALDKLTMILQQVFDWWGRTLKVSQGKDITSDVDLTVPMVPDTVIAVNNDGTKFEGREALMEVNGAWDGEGRQIRGVADPTDNQDAATKHYVEGYADDNFMKLQPDGAAWEARNLQISNVGGPRLVKDAATKDYVDRILEGYSGQGERFKIFDNVAQMKAADLIPSQVVATQGYTDINDGGASVYTIRTKTQSDVDDGDSIIFLDNGNVAELINIENYLPFGYTRTTYTKTGVGTSNVYYAIIPKEYQPELTIANDTINTVEKAETKAYEDKSTLTINAGVFNRDTNVPLGIIVKDGICLRNNDITSPSYKDVLYMAEDGELQSTPAPNTPTEDIMVLNPVWAVQGWEAFVQNGVCLVVDDTAYHPRTCIGQDYDGNYIVLVVEGRTPSSIGMTYYDMYDFVVNQLGINIKFMYNLDGGGSSTFVYHGIRKNPLADQEDRSVPNFLVFRKKNINSDDDFANMYSLAKKEQIERKNNIIQFNTMNWYPYNNDGVFNYYSVDKTTPYYTYTKRWGFGPYYDADKFQFLGRITTDGGNTYGWSEVFKIKDDGDMVFFNNYTVPTKPKALSLTWNENITVSDDNICRVGDFISLYARLTVSNTISGYSSIVSGLPYMHAAYFPLTLLNEGTSAVYALYYSNKKIYTRDSLPAGTYSICHMFPMYKH